jgi:hypothetical protein
MTSQYVKWQYAAPDVDPGPLPHLPVPPGRQWLIAFGRLVPDRLPGCEAGRGGPVA